MIAIGADHGGYDLKQAILASLKDDFRDFGSFTPDPVDYPDIAVQVAKAVASGECQFGILCCGTGIGMSITANKVRGVRAAVLSDEFSAEATRRHNDANILCLGGRIISPEQAVKLVRIFLASPFDGGRHSLRVEKIKAVEDRG